MGMDKGFESEMKSKRWKEMKAAVGRQVQIPKQVGNMTIDELLLNVKAVGLDSIVCQADIKTEEDKKSYQGQGYNIELTVDEFKEKFKVDPKLVWYTPSLSLGCFYFNQETLAACPFHIEFYLFDLGSMNVEDAYKVFESREKEVANNDYMGSILTLPDAMRLEYFSLLIEKKGKDVPGLYRLFFSNYVNSDYGFSNIDRDTLQAILESKTDEDKRETEKHLKGFPDVITIYRGGNSASTPYEEGYSWTMDINVADFFAIRRGNGPGYIVKGEVKKSDVIECLFEDRDEKEVIVDPHNVNVVEIIEIKGLEFLQEVLPKVVPMYQKYRDMLYDLDFYQSSSIHGKEHEARVLLLSLIISEMLNLPSSDRKVLALASIYHDTQRTHDWVEPKHGKASREYYHNSVSNPDPLVEFLCEYHCLPDKKGYEEIKRNRKLSKNRERAIKLYKVFKDADGLDRVRLGNIRKEMDLNQYRLPITRELTLVARICMEQIKI